jgi:hypothetical protein
MSEILVAVHVLSASHLPKTDLIGSIDPYIQARIQDRLARTQTIQNNPNPTWDELIVIHAAVNLDNPSGALSLELWDQDLVDDDAVGVVHVNLADIIRQRLVSLDTPIKLLPEIKPSKAGVATLRASVGYILDQPALRALLEPLRPGIIDEPGRRLLIPTFELSDGAYLEVCYPYQASRALSVAVLCTQPDPESHYDFFIEGTQHLSVDHRAFPLPDPRRGGLGVLRESRLGALSPVSDLSQVWLQHTTSRRIHGEVASTPLTDRGLRGRLSFEAVQSLSSRMPEIRINAAARLAYLPYRYTTLCLDFSTDPVTVFVERYTDPSRAGLAYDLKLADGRPLTTRRHCRHPNRLTLRGHDHLQALELPAGAGLEDLVIEEVFLDNPRRGRLLDLVPLWGA